MFPAPMLVPFFSAPLCPCCMSPECFFVHIQSTWEKGTYIMYHGTKMRNVMRIMMEGFSPSYDGMLGRGVYVTRSFEKASHCPVHSYGERLAVLKLSVRVGKVKRIDYQGHPLQKTWNEHGYDTAWVPPNCGIVNSGLEENCVYDPRRIKVLDIIPNPRLW